MDGVFNAEGTVSRNGLCRSAGGHARQSLEASVATWELGECRDDAREAANASIIALRARWDPKRSSSI